MENPADTLRTLGLDEILEVSVFDDYYSHYFDLVKEHGIKAAKDKHLEVANIVYDTIDLQGILKFISEYSN